MTEREKLIRQLNEQQISHREIVLELGRQRDRLEMGIKVIRSMVKSGTADDQWIIDYCADLLGDKDDANEA